MQSIIVEVHVPATSTRYDFRLPSSGRIGDVLAEMSRILEATQQNLLLDHEQPMLCDRERECILDPQDTVAEAGLRDGSRLILI